MKTFTIILLLSVILFNTLIAVPVDEKTALTVAQTFFSSVHKEKLRSGVKFTLIYKGTSPQITNLKSGDANPSFYVFSTGEKGFIIVAGEDNVTPVLGYSTTNSFNPDSIPQALRKLLDGYIQQIKYVAENNYKANETIQREWDNLKNNKPLVQKRGSVAPLVKTIWDQYPYYNDQCPYDNRRATRTMVGCVATTMAQIMKYWNYPQTGSGFYSYKHPVYGTLSANFGATTYLWQQMPTEVTSTNNAVATLMYHCGVSVDMSYGITGSGAASSKVPTALIKYFGYQNTAKLILRSNYSDADWINLLKTELNNSRPFYYSGTGTSGGHAFVCDGYDSFDYFHINWGWSGMNDGYFSVNSLNPDSYSFNSDQDAVIGIQPPASQDAYKLLLNSSVQVSKANILYKEGFTISANIVNNGTKDFLGDYTAAILDKDKKFVDYVEIKTGYSLKVGQTYSNALTFVTTGKSNLYVGKYYIYIYSRPTGDEWSSMKALNSTISESVELNVIESPNGKMEMNSAFNLTPSSTIFPQQSFSVWLDVINQTGTNFTGSISVKLHDIKTGDELFEIDSKTNYTLQNGAHITNGLTFSTTYLNIEPGSYYLIAWYKPNGGEWTIVKTVGSFQNILEIVVQTIPNQPDSYEVNDEKGKAYNLPVSFSNNIATINTIGSSIHNEYDIDYYKIDLTSGYDYSINVELKDKMNADNFTLDGMFFYSVDGMAWSTGFDDAINQMIELSGTKTIYFLVMPYFTGEFGTYQLDITVNRFTSLSPNLSPYKPSNWSDKIIVNKTLNSFTDLSNITTSDVLYCGWAFFNDNTANISTPFKIDIYVDGQKKWTVQKESMQKNYYYYYFEYPLGLLTEGTHKIKMVIDPDNVIAESNENDNMYEKTIQVNPVGSLTLSRNQLNLSYISGSSESFTITSNTSWSITVSQTWLTVNQTTGINNGTISVNAITENTSTGSRMATITVIAGTIAKTIIVIQEGKIPVLSLSGSAINLSSILNSSGTVNLISNISWTATSDQSWASVSSKNGTNNANITITAIYANTSIEPRTAIVTFSASGVPSVILTITQAGAEKFLTLSKDIISIPSIALSTGNLDLKTNVSWTAVSDQSWLKVEPANGTSDATIKLIAQNDNSKYSDRIATVTFTGSGMSPKTIMVIQLATIFYPNLYAYKPDGWSDKIVVNKIKDTFSDLTTITTNDDLFCYCAYSNDNVVDITTSFKIEIYLDGQKKWTILKESLLKKDYNWSGNFSIGTLSSGTHKIKMVIDPENTISESNENDNVYEKTIQVNAVTLSLSADQINLNYSSGSSETFAITSNTNWTLSTSENWLTISPLNGENNGSITVLANSENPLTVSREATITIKAGTTTKTVTVTQKKVPNSLTVNKESLNVGSVADSKGLFSIQSNTNWSLSCVDSWVIFSTTNGLGDYSNLTFSVSENTSTNSRETEILVSATDLQSKTLKVLQQGAIPFIRTSINLVTLESSDSGQTVIEIFSNTQWNLACDADWISITQKQGSGNALTTITGNENKSIFKREAILKLTAVNVNPVEIKITQKEAKPYFVNNPLVVNLDKEKNSSKEVTFSQNVEWKLSNIPTWLSVSKITGNQTNSPNEEKVIFTTLDINISSANRQADITVSVKGTSDQTITVIQGVGANLIFKATPEIITFQGTKENFQLLTIECNTAWKILNLPEWLKLDITEGTGNELVKLMTTLYDGKPRNATFDVKVNDENSKKITVNQTSVTEIYSMNSETSISIFPNPSKGIFTVDVNNQEIGELNFIIYNLLGKQIHQVKKIKTNFNITQSFDLELQKGIYLIEIQFKNSKIIRKIVIDR
jgi:hypothetical protein